MAMLGYVGDMMHRMHPTHVYYDILCLSLGVNKSRPDELAAYRPSKPVHFAFVFRRGLLVEDRWKEKKIK
jgi:hypothetical protein